MKHLRTKLSAHHLPDDEPIKPLPLYEIGDSLPTPDTWADLRRDLSFLAAESLPDTAREHGIDLVETSVVKLHFIWSHPTGVDLWIYVKNVSPHLNHGPEDESVEARRVTCRMLAAVEADPSQPARRVYDEVVQEEEDMANVPNFRTVRTQLERRRAAFAPPIPHDVDDVVIPGQWAETWDGRQFLSHQDNDWGFIVFATDRNYRKMGRCRVLYMDGTFKSCPEPYCQVLTIHGLYHGRVIPFVMALLVDKTVGAYRALLDHVQRKVRQESGHRLRPDQIVADFEVGLMAAYQTEFPEADTSGCYYHFTQNLWKHIQQLGPHQFIFLYEYRDSLRVDSQLLLSHEITTGFTPHTISSVVLVNIVEAMLILDTLDDLHNVLLRTAIVLNDLHAAVDSFAGERQGNHNVADLAGRPHPHHNLAEPMGEYEQQAGPHHNHYNPAEPMGEYEQQVVYHLDQILHLLETYGVFTDASPTPEMVCLTDAVVITATRHLRATYTVQHHYEGPSSDMLYMLELYRRAMLTRTTILQTHLDGPFGQRLMYMRHVPPLLPHLSAQQARMASRRWPRLRAWTLTTGGTPSVQGDKWPREGAFSSFGALVNIYPYAECAGKSAQTMNVHLLRHLAHKSALYAQGYSCPTMPWQVYPGSRKRLTRGCRAHTPFLLQPKQEALADYIDSLILTFIRDQDEEYVKQANKAYCSGKQQGGTTFLLGEGLQLDPLSRVTRAAKDATHKRYKRFKQVKSFFLGHASVPGVGQTIRKMVMTKEEKQFAEEAEKAAAAFHGHGRGG
ncbi:hypothetical protein Bbelb_318470 [Branchiostoma belcheri]|nr:hypothetical protein Bbelb_318470 [Branchiostoma belcheri]